MPCGLNSSSSSPREVLAHELGVLADVGGDHLLDLPGLEQEAEAEVVDAGVVGGDGEVLHTAVADGGDEVLRDAAEAEAAGGDGHAVEEQAVERGSASAYVFFIGEIPL